MSQDLKQIFKAENKEQAKQRIKSFSKKWYILEEKAIRILHFDLNLCLTYFDFPKEIWKKIRTVNILEREFREVRRRIKVFDNSFSDQNSTERCAQTIFHYLNNNYPQKTLHTKS